MQVHLYADLIRTLRDELPKRESVTRRRSLLRYFARASEVEIKKILQIKKYLTEKTRDLQDAQEFLILLIAINIWRLHGALKASEQVRSKAQKAAIKAQDGRKKSCRDKILSVIDEIHALKVGGESWIGIRTHLKKHHRTMFFGEPLHRDTLRKVYYSVYRNEIGPESGQKSAEKGNFADDPPKIEEWADVI